MNTQKFGTLEVGKVIYIYICVLRWMLLMLLIQLTQMLKVRMWMQSKVLQIKHKVLQYKIRIRVPQFKIQLHVLQVRIKFKSPVGQVPAQGPIQVVQNVPVQPLQQPVPMQPAPAGVVMPAPQIFYQNWIGKKPGIFRQTRRGCRIPSS